MSNDWIGWFMERVFLPTLFAGFFAVALWGVVEGVQRYRAFPAEVACRQQDKDAMRQTFSARVTCVNRIPYPLTVDVK